MVSDAEPRGDGQIYHEIRHGVPHASYNKIALFVPSRIDEIDYGPGCHTCRPAGTVLLRGERDLKMLHYYHLGLDYVAARVKNRRSRFGAFMNSMHDTLNWGHHYFHDIEREFRDLQMRKEMVV